MPKKAAVAVGAIASHDPKAAQKQAKLKANNIILPSPENSIISSEANNSRAKDKAAALPGPIASVSQPNTGRPPPLNMAKNDTNVAAVAASTLIISCPTGLEMPIAINPLREPIIKHIHKPQEDEVASISEGLKFIAPLAPAAGFQPAGCQPAGGNWRTRESKSSDARKKYPK